MRTAARVHAWLTLARIGNLPTVLSNVLVGVVLARGAGWGRDTAWGLAAACAIASLLYVAGMFLNDFVDRDVDRRTRPERPIPAGRITPRAALVATLGLVAAACVIAALRGPACLAWTLGLTAAIVAYDVLHKRHRAALVLMGVCRALVYPLAASAVGGIPPPAAGSLLACALALALYTILLTIGASRETEGRVSHLAAWLLPVAAAVPLAALVPPAPSLLALALAAALLLWLGTAAWRLDRGPDRVRPTVHAWLSGFALLDAWILALLDGPWPVAAALACFAVTVVTQRRIVGT